MTRQRTLARLHTGNPAVDRALNAWIDVLNPALVDRAAEAVDVQLVAGASLVTGNGLAVVLNASGHVVAAGAGATAIGILQNRPEQGQIAVVRVAGVSEAKAAAAIAANQKLAAAAGGALTPATGSAFPLALAREAIAKGAIGEVLVLPGSTTSAGSVGTIVDLETPSGTIDGANTTFTLANAPSPAASLHLYLNGVLQLAGTHFTLSGATITFLAGFIPQVGDVLRASYRY